MPMALSSEQFGVAATNFGAYSSDSKATASTGVSPLMVGDVTLELAGLSSQHPTNFAPDHAFYVHPPASQPLCDDAQSLFAIRSPENTAVPLSINGAALSLNGLTTLHWQSRNSLSLTVHTGSVQIVGGPAAQGGQTLVAVTDNDGTAMLWSSERPATTTEI